MQSQDYKNSTCINFSNITTIITVTGGIKHAKYKLL